MVANEIIKNEIKQSGLKLWQIAQMYGCNDGNFSRKLRKEFTDEQKAKVKSIIIKLREGQTNGTKNA